MERPEGAMDDRQADEKAPHLSTDEARGATREHVARPVLTISLIAIVVIFIILLFIYR